MTSHTVFFSRLIQTLGLVEKARSSELGDMGSNPAGCPNSLSLCHPSAILCGTEQISGLRHTFYIAALSTIISLFVGC